MARTSRKEEIIKAIREYLAKAVTRLEPITDGRLMEAAGCARATFYKYVAKGSEIEGEIETARAAQRKYAESVKRDKGSPGSDLNLRKRLESTEGGNRELLAFIARLIANLTVYGVSPAVIQRSQREAMPHPPRRYSHAGRGRRK